jgi:hypothetical protein
MRRVLSILTVLVGLSLLASPVSAVEDTTMVVGKTGDGSGSTTVADDSVYSDPLYCSGYATLASHKTAAGNVYSTQGNVCLYYLQLEPSQWGTVTRYKCYRNGQLYGDGTGGCRWTWNQAFQTSPDSTSWTTRQSQDWCVTCGGTYVSDTGRNWGNTYSVGRTYIRGVSRSSASTADQVRFYLADGTTVLKNMSDRFSHVGYVS